MAEKHVTDAPQRRSSGTVAVRHRQTPIRMATAQGPGDTNAGGRDGQEPSVTAGGKEDSEATEDGGLAVSHKTKDPLSMRPGHSWAFTRTACRPASTQHCTRCSRQLRARAPRPGSSRDVLRERWTDEPWPVQTRLTQHYKAERCPAPRGHRGGVNACDSVRPQLCDVLGKAAPWDGGGRGLP